MVNETALDQLRETYLNTLPQYIEEMEGYTLCLEKEFNEEIFFSLYRQVHSLKGSGATFGFHIITNICHQLEDTLSQLEEKLTIDTVLVDCILKYIDVLRKAYTLIYQDQKDFSVVERELAALKQGSHNHVLHGLVVENSQVNISLIKGIFNDYDCNMAYVNNGLEALQRLLHEKFDFLITSYELASLNGIALISATKLGSSVNKNIRTALITANPNVKIPECLLPNKIIVKNVDLPISISEFVNEL